MKKLETDIAAIKKLSEEKEAENWGFRSFLKSAGVPSSKIDLIVRHLEKKVSGEIDCNNCANCCREIHVVVREKDITDISRQLNLTKEEFIGKYLKLDDEAMGEDKYVFNAVPCPFLENNLCSIYNFRPQDCRSYPHLHKKRFSERTISVIHNLSVCPIVYNVYEQLKSEIWGMDDFDDFY